MNHQQAFLRSDYPFRTHGLPGSRPGIPGESEGRARRGWPRSPCSSPKVGTSAPSTLRVGAQPSFCDGLFDHIGPADPARLECREEWRSGGSGLAEFADRLVFPAMSGEVGRLGNCAADWRLRLESTCRLETGLSTNTTAPVVGPPFPRRGGARARKIAPSADRARSTNAIVRAPPPGLPQCHGCSSGGGRLLLRDAVAEPSHDCSPLKE